jgi:DNA-directed RNA polymerase specialized sigma subunit
MPIAERVMMVRNANADCGEGDDGSTELGDLLKEEELHGYDENMVKFIAANAATILSALEYRVFSMHYFEEMSIEYIAEDIGVSTQRIYQLRIRAISKMKDFMAAPPVSAKRA